MSRLLPEIINNRYRPVKELGQGGMGIVYLVEDTLRDNMLFALKTIKQNILNKFRNTSTEAFKNEYEIMMRLKHPNLTRVYDFGIDKGNYYIVMEYLKGRLLRECRINSNKAGIEIIVQILRTLEYIHSRNIVYRDINPRNIIIFKNNAKLMDFGLSGSIKKKEESIRGTMLYMPPEALSGNIAYSSDIFSTGIVFYEILTGSFYYDSRNRSFSNIVHLLDDLDKYEAFQNRCMKEIKNQSLRKIVQKMTSYHKSDRYEHCSEVIADINSKLNCNYEYETAETKKSYVLGNAFADRIDELCHLKASINYDDKGSFYICTGPPGIGKTRLFFEFKKYCKLNNLIFMETSCIEGNSDNYRSFSEILSQLILLSPKALLESYGRYLKLILPENPYLKQYISPDIRNDPRMLRDVIVHNITDYIIEFVRKSEGHKYLIYFNDLQWIDSGSAYILNYLLKMINADKEICSRLMLYANVNKQKLQDNKILSDIFNMKGIMTYELSPLGIEGVHEYIENIFGSSFLSKSIKDAIRDIRELVGGNPLFLEELIKSLIENNIIIKDKKYWRLLKAVNETDIPDNIMDIINNKINELFKDDKKRKILKVLSLLRLDVNIDTISSIIKRVSDIDTATILLELENIEILQSFSRQNTSYYSFNSSIIKDQIKKSIDNKEEISLFLAETLESLPISNTLTEEIAYHYLEGRNSDKAIYYYIKCGVKSQESFFNDKAIIYYDTALRLLEESKDYDKESLVNIMLKKAEILDLTGKFDESEKLYKKSIDISRSISDKSIFAKSYMKYGWLIFIKGKYDKALQYFESSLQLYETLMDKEGIGTALSHIGNVYNSTGQYSKALEYFKKQKKLAEEIRDSQAISLAAGNMGNVFYRMGEYTKSLYYYEIKKKISEDTRNEISLGSVIGNMGNVYLNLCEYEKSLQCYKESRDISEKTGDKRGISMAVGNMGNSYYRLGQYTESLECYEIKKKISEELGDRQEFGNIVGNIGNIHAIMKDYDKALECYEIFKKISEESGNIRGVGMATGNMGYIYNNLGLYDKALKCFNIYKKIAEDIGYQYGYASASGNLGIAYYWIGDYEKALEKFEIKKSISEKLGNKIGIASSARNIATIHLDKKEFDKALENINYSIRTYKELKSKIPELAEALIIKSRYLLYKNDIENSLETIREAIDFAKDINDPYYIISAKIQKLIIEASKDKKATISSLLLLLSEDMTKEQKADIYYELFFLDKNKKYQKSALELYKVLYAEKPSYQLKIKIEELEQTSNEL